MPRLHRAKTVPWGLLKWGMYAWMVIVHSVTRGWQDILFLLRGMGYMATHTTPDRRRVLPLYIARRNIIDSKTYPRKVDPWGTYHYRPGCKRYWCNGCRRTFNDLTATLLHQSKRSLAYWMLATFLLCLSCSSRRIARELGVHGR